MYLLAHSFIDHSASRPKAYKAPQNLWSVDKVCVEGRWARQAGRATEASVYTEGFRVWALRRRICTSLPSQKRGYLPSPPASPAHPCHVQGSDQRSLL